MNTDPAPDVRRRAVLDWIAARRRDMIDETIALAEINSHTGNPAGCGRVSALAADRLRPLGAAVSRVEAEPFQSVDDAGRLVTHSPGPILLATQRPALSRRVLLNIHLDTVYPSDHPFQKTRWLDDATLNGPGVADAKGGLVVLLTVLEALERFEYADRIGWQVLLNSDEEIGSPGSRARLLAAAKESRMGMVFEPATADGDLVGPRKGSGTFTFVLHGRSAHAGRDFAEGRSAVIAMSNLVLKLHALNGLMGTGVVVNVGKVHGGAAVNAVPDFAIARVNCRTSTAEDERRLREAFADLLGDLNRQDGIRAELHGDFFSPPKPLEGRSLEMMNDVITAGKEIGLTLRWKPGGGTCDGNKLAAAGLPVVDTFGPVGGALHSPQEFIKVDSLVERASLAALVLMRYASTAE